MQGRNPAEVEATSPYIAYQEAMTTRFKQRKEFRLQEDEKMVFYFNIFTYNTICLTLVFILKLMEKELKLMEKEDKASDNQVVQDNQVVIKIYETKTLIKAFASYMINAFIRDRWPKSKHFFTEAKKCEFVKLYGCPYYLLIRDNKILDQVAQLETIQTVQVKVAGTLQEVEFSRFLSPIIF